jgi:hypothetical protein
MNEHEQQKLDRLLRDWSTGERADSKQLERLADRIKAAIDDNVQPAAGFDVLVSPIPRSNVRWRTRLAWFSLGVAATVLVAAAFILRHAVGERSIADPAPADADRFARMDAAQIHNRAVLFDELRTFYAGNLAWMAEVDGKVVLRLDSLKLASTSAMSPSAAGDARERSLTVRLVVVARTPGDEGWRTLWNADVIAGSDQLVEVGPEAGTKHALAVWAHALPDGRVAVDTRFSLEGDKSKAWTYSGVQQQAVPERILTHKAGNIEYRVFQMVAILPEKVG